MSNFHERMSAVGDRLVTNFGVTGELRRGNGVVEPLKGHLMRQETETVYDNRGTRQVERGTLLVSTVDFGGVDLAARWTQGGTTWAIVSEMSRTASLVRLRVESVTVRERAARRVRGDLEGGV